MRVRLHWVCLSALAAVACGGEGGFEIDASGVDASMPPPYRPPRCGAGVSGGSGVQDAACADGGVSPLDAGFDAAPPPPPCNEITFSYRDATATSVWLSGSWLADADGVWPATPAEGALELVREGDTWSVTTLVEPIGRHLYKFIIDGDRWVPDPANPDREPDSFGGFNSVLDVCGASCGDPTEFDWRDTVMYFAMVDRFRDSDGRADPVPGASDGDATRGASGQYEGGDLRGATDRLAYLADLGVTAVWLSAPYENRDLAGAAIDPAADPHMYSAYHGYWPSPRDIDYADPDAPSPTPAVESRIGSAADLRAFVDTAHGTVGANGHPLKVLFDYVMNHVDIESELYRNHPDWFARDGGRIRLCGPENLWDDPFWGTRCAFTDYLPPFDFDVPAAREWSVDDALWWAKEYDIDGYRLDAIKHVPLAWLRDLRARLEREITDAPADRFYLVGETFAYDDPGLIRSFVDPDTMLDGQFDFPFKARLCEAVFTPGGNLRSFADWMAVNDSFYGPGAIMTTWIGNHDIPRAIHFASRQIGNCREGSSPGNGWIPASFPQPTDAPPYERLALAFAVMMTNPGIPLIYYGDEIGLAGGGDPDNRRMMPWDDGALNVHQRALRDRVRALARLRGANPVLGRGRRVTVSADADTWVYRMVGCDDSVLVAINKADAPRSVALPAGTYEDLLEGGSVSGTVSLPPRSYLVLR